MMNERMEFVTLVCIYLMVIVMAWSLVAGWL